jgi:hypothetical protein
MSQDVVLPTEREGVDGGDVVGAYDAWLADLKPFRTLVVATAAFGLAAILVGATHVDLGPMRSEFNIVLALLASSILAIRFVTRPKTLRRRVMVGSVSPRDAVVLGVAVGFAMALIQVAMRLYQYHGSIRVGAFAIAFGFAAVPFAAVDYAVFFQGLLQTRLVKWIGKAGAIALVVCASVLVFTPSAPVETLAAIIVALGPAYLRMRTQSMLSCILAYGTQLTVFTVFECAAYL